jgi:hypothetical protein
VYQRDKPNGAKFKKSSDEHSSTGVSFYPVASPLKMHKHRAMEATGVVEVKLHAFLTNIAAYWSALLLRIAEAPGSHRLS